MRPGFVVACLAALLCGSCGNAMQRGNLLQATYGAYGQPAGYYAGRAEPFGGDPAEFTAWLAKNQAGIDDIQRRIIEIRDGKRAPGCIGEDQYTCVATLAQKLAVADEFHAKDLNIFAEIKYDVNGKPVNGSQIMFDGYAPNAKGNPIHDHHTTFFLKLGRQGEVSSIDARLPKNPALARTQEEYDQTDVYETISAVTARGCPTLGRAEVAKWVENMIKPNSEFKPTEHRKDPDGDRITSRDLESKEIDLCGRKFVFHTVDLTIQHGFQHERSVSTRVEIN